MKKNNSLISNKNIENVTTFPLVLSENTLHQYVRLVNQYATMPPEEERSLLLEFHQTQEWRIAQKLVLANLKFVVFISRSFAGYQLNQADLIQEGNIGLIKAVKHYDPVFNVRLMAFAVHWIKSEIYEFILNNWKIVKIANNKHQRKLFFNLRKFFQNNLKVLPSIEKIAQELDVPVHEVHQMKNRLFSGPDLSFEALTEDTSDQNHIISSFEDRQQALVDQTSDFAWQISQHQEQQENFQTVYRALKNLDERSRDIIYSRWIKSPKETLKNLSEKYNISLERVRQLEKKALEKFREHVRPPTAPIYELNLKKSHSSKKK